MDTLDLIQKIGRLKEIPRTGWVRRNIAHAESVADHSFRVAFITLLLADKLHSSKEKLLSLALLHDIAESEIGDLTPDSEEYKDKNEKELNVADSFFGNTDLGKLMKEYIDQTTPEAQLVQEIDRFEMILQAWEYSQKEGRPELFEEFFINTEKKITHPLLRAMLKRLQQ